MGGEGFYYYAYPDSSGDFSETNCTVPNNLPAGSYSITAYDWNDRSVTATAAGDFDLVAGGISLGQSNVSDGASDSLSGYGFAANESLSVTFGGTDITAASGSPSSNGDGQVSFDFTVPDVTAGSYPIEVSDTSGDSATEEVTVFTPTISFSPTSGAPYSTFTCTGTGWPPGDPILLNMGGEGFYYYAYPDSSGDFSETNCTVPNNLPAGSYSIFAYDYGAQSVTATSAGDFDLT
jgi:hypothetical protein